MNTATASRKTRALTMLSFLATAFSAGGACAAPQGELDASFGENGRMSIQVLESKFGGAISQQPADGKLLFAGYYNGDVVGRDFAVLRLNSDGSIDRTFGSNGVAAIDFGSSDAVATRLAVQPDGKIIVAGSARVGVGMLDLALARLNTDGSIDSTFGMDGLLTLDLGGSNESSSDIVPLQSGQFVVVGTTDANGDQDAAFLRFGSNGALDTTFGSGSIPGSTVVGVNGRSDEIYSMIQQPDGKFVACGAASDHSELVYIGDMLAIRVNADGSVDTGFGASGVARTATDQSFSNAQSCVVMPSGTIVMAGFHGEPGMISPALVRLMPDGRLDTTFGSAGVSSITVDHIAWAQAIVLLDDGTLGMSGFTIPLVGTNLPTDLFLARINADSGQLDSAFGNEGVTIVDFGQLNRSPIVQGRGLIAQADGKLIAVGDDSRSSLSLARVDLAGSGNAGFAGFVGTSATIAEGASLAVAVRRTGGSTGSLSIDYSSVGDSATAPADFAAVSGTLSWPDGDMAPRFITLRIAENGGREGIERFSVVLSNSTNGLAASEFMVDIADQDTTPPAPPLPPQGGGGGGGGGGASGFGELFALALIWACLMRRPYWTVAVPLMRGGIPAHKLKHVRESH